MESPSRPETVLVVEDNNDIRDSLVLVFELAGIPVAQAENGRKALAYLASHAAPCLIVLDVMMPVMDGLQFRRAQLEDHALSRIPVVVCTAREDYRDDIAFRGVAAFLTKPVDPLRLLDLVREYTRPAGAITPRPLAD